MRRFLLFIALLALVAAACGGAAGTAATVDGESISVADVEALVPGDTDALDANQTALLLFNLIADKVVRSQAEEDFSLAIDATEFDTEKTALINQLTSQGQTLEEVLEQNQATEALLDIVVEQQILIPEVQDSLLAGAGPPSDTELELEYEAQRPSLTSVCSSHILLESQDDAQSALDRALAGEDFADLAIELSTGPSGPSGGDLGAPHPSSSYQSLPMRFPPQSWARRSVRSRPSSAST